MHSNGTEWFYGARFGMFIHWGIYSVLGRGEQVLFREHLKPSEYARLAQKFNPGRFDAHEWAKCARDAGMKYMVLTAKHHDGFCLFNSCATDYTSVKTAAKRDIVKEYTDACRNEGLKVGIYYSLCDWRFPAYFNGPAKDPEGFARFVDYIHTQVEELCTNYGKIDLLWFDGDWPYNADGWQSVKLMQIIRRHQPDIIVNNRLPKPEGEQSDWGYPTPEQEIKASSGRAWESCLTSVHRWWGYHSGDRMWMPAWQIIANIIAVAAGGGNLLLNVGPKPDGTFPEPFTERMKQVGVWMKASGEAVCDCSPGVCEFITNGYMTVRGNTVYLNILYWPGTEVHLSGLDNRVISGRFLATGKPVEIQQEGEHIYIKNLPSEPPDEYCTVIALEVEGRPKAYPWAVDRLWSGDASRMAGWAVT